MKARVSLLCLSLLCLGQMCGSPAPQPPSSPIAEGTYEGSVHTASKSMINTDVYEEWSDTDTITILFGSRGLPFNDQNQEIAVGDREVMSIGSWTIETKVTSIVTNINSVVVRSDATMTSAEGYVFQGPGEETYTATGPQTIRYHGVINIGAVLENIWVGISTTSEGTLSRL